MTTKLEYLKEFIKDSIAIEDKNWYIGLFSILLPNTKELTHRSQVLRRSSSMVYAKEVDGVLVETMLVDAKPGIALFTPTDKLEIDNTWLPHIQGKITTTVGRLIVSAACIYPVIGGRIPYNNKAIKISKLENDISALVKNDDELKNPDKDISVKQYLDCMDRLWFLTKLSNLVTVASSPRSVLPPPGIAKLRDQLLKENEGKLSDPVVVASISDKLNQYDLEYMSEDPNAKLIVSGKGTTARKKLFHMYGETNDFVESLGSDPITNTMQEGLEVSEKNFPKYNNDLRYASFSRGHSTQLAGYSYKILQRSLSGIEVTDEPCNTTKGLVTYITKPDKLVNRYVKAKSDWLLIETIEQTKQYADKEVEVRSPMYCTTKGNFICYKCLGESYKGSKNAINHIAAGFSGALMTQFLKRMHTSGFKLTEVHMKDLVT